MLPKRAWSIIYEIILTLLCISCEVFVCESYSSKYDKLHCLFTVNFDCITVVLKV